MIPALEAEWLETDGLGGFASGTVGGWRTRRYHGVLTPAVEVPSRRAVLVDGFEAWYERAGVRTPLTTQHYAPEVFHPDGHTRLAAFAAAPWPRWTWRLAGDVEITQELVLPHERPAAVLRWRVNAAGRGGRLVVRPLLSGRDSHALHHENPALRAETVVEGERVRWQPYAQLPPVQSLAAADYQHDPQWYRNFLLAEERERGFEHRMDLWSPGELCWDLTGGEAVWVLLAEGIEGHVAPGRSRAATLGTRLIDAEATRRGALGDPLVRAGDQYLVRRGAGKTIIAGYPWFTDWGRDTFIALRGLCLATGRLDDARDILREWAGQVSEGMLPNRFVEGGDQPEFNTVDASLWYVVAVHEYLEARRRVPAAERQLLLTAVGAILEGPARGTRYGILMDADGLLAAGPPGVQLTWMGARVGEWVVTPRIGKPVEIQALWINALRIGATSDARWGPIAERATRAFGERFWLPGGYLADVVDADHVPGAVDDAFRPNQVLALGGLPWPVLDTARGRQLLEGVEERLWTPMGLRSLAPDTPGYRPRYVGGPVERDGAYHQGTVWPGLAGPLIEAWVRGRGDTPAARAEARGRVPEPRLWRGTRLGLGPPADAVRGLEGDRQV